MKTATLLASVVVVAAAGVSGCGDEGCTTDSYKCSGGPGGEGPGGAGTGGATTGSGGATSGTAGTGGGGVAGAGGTGTGGAEVQCTGATPVFPAFDKACRSSAECVLKFHQINCCGTRVAIGIHQHDSAAFDAAEATCESQYPGCGCAQQPTTAEDGQTGDESSMMVECKMGSCQSFVP